MKTLVYLLVLSTLTALSVGCASTNSVQKGADGASEAMGGVEASAEEEGPELIADQLFWTGPEGNLGMDLFAKFNSTEELYATLDLNAEIGQFDGRAWKLGEVLVYVDLNANGNVASWLVSGPKPLIEAYADKLQTMAKDDKAIYSFNATPYEVAPSAFFEAE